jgi:hypothetical protein
MTMSLNGTDGIGFPDGSQQSSGKQALKALFNFNGTGAIALLESYNVTSLTDLGVGHYKVNFTTPMASSAYAFSLGYGTGSGMINTQALATGYIEIETFNSAGSATDRAIVTGIIASNN